MNVIKLVEKMRERLGDIDLPLAFWYSHESIKDAPRSKGCYIPELRAVMDGEILSYSKKNLSCPGGRVFAGFDRPFPGMKNFVSKVEGYKQSPAMVKDFLPQNDPLEMKYLNFGRIDKLHSLDGVEGLIFFAGADTISGLSTWAFYDNNRDDAVSTIFGSGCSSIVTKVYEENRRNGNRTFLGMLDPSARKGLDSNVLSFAIPMSRLKTMFHTLDECFLVNNSAWKKIRSR